MLRCGESFAVSDTELSDGWCHVPCGRSMCVSDGVDGRRSWVGAVIVEADDSLAILRISAKYNRVHLFRQIGMKFEERCTSHGVVN